MRITVGTLALLAALLNYGTHAADKQFVWSDEFNQPDRPIPAKWTCEEGFVANNEAQFHTRARKESARDEAGNLVIEAWGARKGLDETLFPTKFLIESGCVHHGKAAMKIGP